MVRLHRISFSLETEFFFSFQHHRVIRNYWTQSFMDCHPPPALIPTEGPEHGRQGDVSRHRCRHIRTGNTPRGCASSIPWLTGPVRNPKTRKARRRRDHYAQKQDFRVYHPPASQTTTCSTSERALAHQLLAPDIRQLAGDSHPHRQAQSGVETGVATIHHRLLPRLQSQPGGDAASSLSLPPRGAGVLPPAK